MKFTKELRQQIVQDFCSRNGGIFNPILFLEEVRERGAEHPAYGWFEWDASKAAREYQLIQARNFANDLRINFTVEEIGPRRSLTIREVEGPMFISPMANRQAGGGYFEVDPNDPVKMAEYCGQAALALRTFLRRYEAAVVYAGGNAAAINKTLELLDGKAVTEVAA